MYKVLIVEDELLVCRGLNVLVNWETLGFTIGGFCRDGLTAQRQLEMEKYDLLLCDLHIPGMDGLDLIHWIRTKKMPLKIIIITAYAKFEYARQAVSEGVFEYLVKPIDEALLESALRRVKEALDAEAGRGTAAPSQTEDDAILDIVQQIHADLSRGLTVEKLAREHYMSPGQLEYLFRKRFHTSIKACITSTKLERAKRLLTQSDRLIYEIAAETGFSDVDYFTQWFRHATGLTPSDYRKLQN